MDLDQQELNKQYILYRLEELCNTAKEEDQYFSLDSLQKCKKYFIDVNYHKIPLITLSPEGNFRIRFLDKEKNTACVMEFICNSNVITHYKNDTIIK